MTVTYNDILKLTKQLLPTGRAWKIPIGGVFHKLLYALGKSEQRAYQFGIDTLNRIMPDNDNFTAEDATEWERRLAIISNGYIPLEIRKATILRKMQFPGEFLNRQNYRYIESQLQIAGYNVTVTENYDDIDITDTNVHSIDTLHSSTTLHGKAARYSDVIANSVDKGELYDPGNYKGVFNIDGSIPANSIRSFRQLVLTLKPVNTMAILNLEYTNEKEFVFITGDNFYTQDGRQLILVR